MKKSLEEKIEKIASNAMDVVQAGMEIMDASEAIKKAYVDASCAQRDKLANGILLIDALEFVCNNGGLVEETYRVQTDSKGNYVSAVLSGNFAAKTRIDDGYPYKQNTELADQDRLSKAYVAVTTLVKTINTPK